jgi:hypothetical protein
MFKKVFEAKKDEVSEQFMMLHTWNLRNLYGTHSISR